MMLVIMHQLVPNRRQRIVYGSAIVIAVNCGGALTVIGDPIGLVLWNSGAVTASNFSLSLVLPCLISCALPIMWLGRTLPSHVEIQWDGLPYRGDDTNLNRWQRMLMLVVGIGGLWFIPTFHNITKLSPFLGALCVLSLLWIVNEIMNHKLMNTDQMIHRKVPRVLQYSVIQLILFVMGIMLAMGVTYETGILGNIASFLNNEVHNVWILGILAGLISSVVDSFATTMGFVTLFPVMDMHNLTLLPAMQYEYASHFVQNGLYWKIIAYSSAMGGNILLIGAASGLALVKMEKIHIRWFFKEAGAVSAAAWLLGLAVMWAMN